MKPLKKNKRMKIPRNPLTKVVPGWTQGGTLHKSTLKQWHKADFGNGLATCAGWVMEISKMDKSSITIDTGDQLLAYAMQLVTAITKSTENVPESWYMKTNEVAVVAAGQLGWFK